MEHQSVSQPPAAVPVAPTFAHLHVHSEYSLVDGTIKIKELVKHVKAMGQTHVAVTDHSNMHGAIELYSAAKDAGIKAIIGCEIYQQGSCASRDALKNALPNSNLNQHAFQLVLLAQNTNGYKSLLRVVSAGYMGAALQAVPTVPEATLDSEVNDLVALASCSRSELSTLVAALRQVGTRESLALHPETEAERSIYTALAQHIAKMQQRFGAENFYIELTDNNLPGQRELVNDLVATARHFGVPFVATANAHYLKAEQAETHILALAIKNGLSKPDLGGRLRNTCFHVTSNAEMETLFSAYPEALQASITIAEKCSHVKIEMGKYYLPKLDCGAESPATVLTRLAQAGLEERITQLKPLYGAAFNDERQEAYRKRLAFELTTIISMGFPDYFLIVADFIGWAKRQSIPVGPGRGSGAGSLVAYSLKITDLDPIPYNLIFERFLNPERVSMPDFDIDFCQWRREEVIQYCIDKYGARNVAQITTFGKLQAKAAVKAVGRAMDLGYTRVDRFTKLFPPDLGITLKKALEAEPRLNQEMKNDSGLEDCMNYALKLEGLISHASVHAAGIVMSDGDMTNYVPIYTTDGKTLITQYEMKPTEKVGLVKFDFLGLKTLSVIAMAVNFVRQRRIPDFAIETIPLDDRRVYQMISTGATCGIFQCEGGGMTNLILKLQPSTFEDIIALVALFRPGPLGSGMVDDFIERKHGRQQIEYLHPLLADILKETYGMIVYQEQVQKIAATLASYSLGEADLLRRAMGKKIPEEMEQQKTRFISGAVANSIDRDLAEEIFDLMAEFANYGFNKSHSATYGLITYQTAYLKTHFPEEFQAASMSCDKDNTDKIVRYIEDCRRLGITVKPPDLNTSSLDFDVPADKTVGFALTAIKGVGGAVLEPLLQERKAGGPFTNLAQLAQRVHLGKLGKKTLQLLIQAGALDSLGFRRSDLDANVDELVRFSTDYFDAKAQGQRSLFASASTSKAKPIEEWRASKPLRNDYIRDYHDLLAEKKILGTFLTGHPLEIFKEDVRCFSSIAIKDMTNTAKNLRPGQRAPFSVVAFISGVDERRTKNGMLIAYVGFEQPDAKIEGVMFGKALAEGPRPEVNSLAVVTGQLENQVERGLRISVAKVEPLDRVRLGRVKKLKLGLNERVSELPEVMRQLRENAGATPIAVGLEFPEVRLAIETPYRVAIENNGLLMNLFKAGVEVSYLI